MGAVDKNFYKPVADKIKLARESAHLTQKMLASLVGLTRAAIANIESGRQQILLHTLYKIAEACNADPVRLLPEINTAKLQAKSGNALKKELKKKLSADSASKILKSLEGYQS